MDFRFDGLAGELYFDITFFNRDETNRRVIDPYHMAYKDGFWYLVAYCHWRGEERLFQVDRIKHIKILTKKFKNPAEDYRKPHWNIAWGIELGDEYVFMVRFRGMRRSLSGKPSFILTKSSRMARMIR